MHSTALSTNGRSVLCLVLAIEKFRQAGLSLIDWSHLAFWNGDHFEASTRYAFEDHHRKVHEQFGRLICWLQFSVGAEYLAKGFCLVHEIPIVDPSKPKKKILKAPIESNLDSWITAALEKKAEMDDSEIIGAFNRLLNPDSPRSGLLMKACTSSSMDSPDIDRVLVAYIFLIQTIRNRDAHFYAKNIREEQFYLVPELFVPCFNAICASERMRKVAGTLSIVSSGKKSYGKGEGEKD